MPVNQAAATAGGAPVSQSNAPQFQLPSRPQPRAQVGSPAPAMPPSRPINLGYGAAGVTNDAGSMVGQPNWNDAALGSQIMGDRFGAGRAPVQGPLSAFAGNQQSPPFTMVLRPNAPAESGGRQGGNSGGSPLAAALDLSGYQPQAPAADPAYHADPRYQSQAPAPAPHHVARAPAVQQGWRGFPQVQPGGVGVMRPTWWNPAVGGSTVGMGN